MFISKLVCMDRIKKAIYQLRYDVYIKEMGMPNHYADHHSQQIIDPRDTDGTLFACYANEQLVGTVLGTPANSKHLGEFADLYQLEQYSPKELEMTFFTSLLVFKPSFRATQGVTQILRYLTRYFYDRGFRTCLIHCFPKDLGTSAENYTTTNAFVDIESYCKRLGYEIIGQGQLSDLKQLNIMRLNLSDIDHLKQVRSPLLSCLPTQRQPQGDNTCLI